MTQPDASPCFAWGLCCVRAHADGQLRLAYIAPGLSAVLDGVKAGDDLRTVLVPEDLAALRLPSSHTAMKEVSVRLRLLQRHGGEPLPVLFSGVWEYGTCWGVAAPQGEDLLTGYARLQEWYGGFRTLLQTSNQQAYEWDLSCGSLREAGYQSVFWRELMRAEPLLKVEKDGLPSAANIYEADRHAFRQLHASVLAGGAGGSIELRMRTGYGIYRWCRLTLTTLYDAAGNPEKAVGLLTDIEYEKREQLALLRRVSRDGLTGLYNGAAFLEQLAASLTRTAGKTMALHLICMDGYGGLVDRLGWVEARGLLVHTANQLTELGGSEALCGRIAEDTFALLAPSPSLRSAFKTTQLLCDGLRRTVVRGLQSEKITFSVGMAFVPKVGLEQAQLLRQADAALGRAKETGGAAVCYQKELQDAGCTAGLRFGSVADGEGKFDNNLLFTFFDRLYNGEDAERAVADVLQLAGEHFHADRAYIYRADEENAATSHLSYEWCAPGVPSSGTLGRAVDSALISGPENTEHFYCEDITALPAPFVRYLKKRSVTALLQYNLTENGTMRAAVGFHTCAGNRLWTSEEKESLALTAKLLGGFLLRVEMPERVVGRDPLTGLQLWPRFREKAARRLAEPDSAWQLLVLDIVRFRDINELFGTDVGDRLLARYARSLRRRLDEDELACRLTSTRTALLLRRKPGISARERLDAFQKSFAPICRTLIGTHKFTVMGGVVDALPGDSPDTLREKAQLACIRAKQAGVPCTYYGPVLERQYTLRTAIRKNQQDALKNREFALYLQPKYSAQTGLVSGSGAWVRWNTHADGQLLNSQFLPVFRENGFVLDLDYELIDLICTALAAWPAEKRQPVSLRIDRLHFAMADFVARMSAICAAHGIAPELLCLELQEDAFLGDNAQRLRTLRELKRLGFKLMLSGFGKGWSSLDVLAGCPFDVLRLDGSFFAAPGSDKQRIAPAVCAMAKNLGLKVTAEGVETAEQAAFLRSIGVDELQGDLFEQTLSAKAYAEKFCTLD